MTQQIRIQNLEDGGPYKVKVSATECRYEVDKDGASMTKEVVESHVLEPGDEADIYIWDGKEIEIVEDGEVE